MTTTEIFSHDKASHDSSFRKDSSGHRSSKYTSKSGDGLMDDHYIVPSKLQRQAYVPVCEPERSASILDGLLQCQKHANRNLNMIEEHLLWCQDCVARLDAIARSMDRALRSTTN